MKKLIILAALLAGCANAPQQDPMYAAFREYVAVNWPKVERGEIKRSEYHSERYRLASLANAPGYALTEMNESHRAAQELEAGTIDKATYDYRLRAALANATSQHQAAQQNAQAAQAQADAQSREAWSRAGAALMAAGQPQPVVQQQRQGSYLQRDNLTPYGRQCVYQNGVIVTMQGNTFCLQWNYN